MSNETNITVDVRAMREASLEFSGDRANRIARNAVTAQDLAATARTPLTMRAYQPTFNVRVPRTGKVCNQRASGRCWNFSALNVVRAAMRTALDVDDFEFSEAYGMFFDKLEKANAMLENVIATADLACDNRKVAWILDYGIDDGGFYTFSMNLLSKWGAVPAYAMPETACSKNSRQMNEQLQRLLRRDAAVLRAMAADGASPEDLREQKQDMLADVHKVLCVCLGEPPVTFDVRLEVGKNATVDPDHIVEIAPLDSTKEDAEPKRMLVHEDMTPQDFLTTYVDFDPSDYVDLVNIPAPDAPLGRAYHATLTDSVVGGRPNHMLNMPVEVLEQAAIASLKAGVPCVMSCDVGQNFERTIKDYPGILALDTMDYEGVLDVELGMTREQMIEVRETCLTHGMCFQGVDLDEDGNPRQWLIENSWGDKIGEKGYLTASADWFRLFGGEVCVRREFVPADVLELWDDEDVTDMAPWSGFGQAVGHHSR